MELKEGTIYLIRNDREKYRHFEGIFKEYVSLPYGGVPYMGEKLAPKFINCYCYRRNDVETVDQYSDSNYYRSSNIYELNLTSVFADPIHTRYYDAEKVKNAHHAKQNRERRTVNMIIRRFIGDPNFEW